MSTIALTDSGCLPSGGGFSRRTINLTAFYANDGCRWMVYLCTSLLAGLATLLALAGYGYLFQAQGSPATFRGVYAWATALNLGVCHLIVDEGSYRLGARWKAMRSRSLPALVLVWGTIFCCFMLVQRSLVYAHTASYHPVIVRYYTAFPDARPGWMEMTLFCLPFWLAIAATVFVLARKVEIHRSRRTAARPREAAPHPASGTLWVGSGASRIALPPARISHIAVEDHYCRFFLEEAAGGREVLVLMALKAVVARLPAGAFFQIHRSHVVRLGAVAGIEKRGRRAWVRLRNRDHCLPVSRGRLAAFKQALRMSGQSAG